MHNCKLGTALGVSVSELMNQNCRNINLRILSYSGWENIDHEHSRAVSIAYLDPVHPENGGKKEKKKGSGLVEY